jgi:AraC-like DNA-binding protein
MPPHRHPPHVRYATIGHYPGVARDVGLDPSAMMRAHGLEPAPQERPEQRIPAAAVVALLEDTAARSGRDDIGLRMAERRTIATLGPLSLALREELDVRGVIELLIRYEHLYNDVTRISLTESDETAVLRVDLRVGDEEAARQSVELAIGALLGILREFLGAAWQPVRVDLPHLAPVNEEAHRRVIGERLVFGSDQAAVVLSRRELDTRLAASDPQLRVFAQQYLSSLGAPRDAGLTDRVRELVEVLLPRGSCSAEEVASRLAITRRTLHRRLAVEGTTLSALVAEVRRTTVERLIAEGRPLIEASLVLGFASPSGLSRWFRQQYGCSPSAWAAVAARGR